MRTRLALVALLVGVVVLAGVVYSWTAAPTPTVNPICREQRNNTSDPVPAEPNRADIIEVRRFNAARQYAKAFELLLKIDVAGTGPLAELPPTTPHIDQVIDAHIANLVFARSITGHYFERGELGVINNTSVVTAFQRAVDTSFTDDRGCEHRVRPSMEVLVHLAGMYAYGIGVPADRAKAIAVFDHAVDEKTRPIVEAINKDQLPQSYRYFLEVMPKRWSDVSLNERTNMMLRIFGIDVGPTPGPWFHYALIAGFLSVIAAVVAFTGYELHIKARNDGRPAPRGLAAMYEIARTALGRFDLFFKGAFSLFFGLMTLQYFSPQPGSGWWLSGWFIFQPWMQILTNYTVAMMLLVSVLHGLFSMIETFRSTTTPANTGVHGGARPAAEAEAQAAARGIATTPALRDRKFTE